MGINSAFRATLIVLATAAAGAGIGCSGRHAAPVASAEPQLSAPAFVARLNSDPKPGQPDDTFRLGQANRYVLRDAFALLLNDAAAVRGPDATEQRSQYIDRATIVAGLINSLGHDDYPLRTVRFMAGWNSNEWADKSHAEDLLRAADSAYQGGRTTDFTSGAARSLHEFAALGDVGGELEAYHTLGKLRLVTAVNSHDLTSAEAFHRSARALARRNRDRFGEGQALIDIGDVDERRKQEGAAIDAYESALALAVLPEDWREASLAQQRLGDIFVDRGDFERAFSAYGAAFAYAKAAADPISLAEASDYLGYVSRELGDFDGALSYHSKALVFASHIDDFKLRTTATDRAYNHLGLVYEAIAEDAVAAADRARAHLASQRAEGAERSALQGTLSIQDEWREGYVRRALSSILIEASKLEPVGVRRTKKLRDALDNAQKALLIARREHLTEWRVHALSHLGVAQAGLGLAFASLASMNAALTLSQKVHDTQARAETFRLRAGEIDEPSGKFAEAISDYDLAIAEFEQTDAHSDISTTYCLKGALLQKRGDYEGAQAAYTKSIDGFEALVDALLAEHRSIFIRARESCYDNYIGLLRDRELRDPNGGYKQKSFEILERKNARVLLEEIAATGVRNFNGVEPTIIAQDKATEEAVESAQRKVSESDSNRGAHVPRAAAQLELDRAARQRQVFEKFLRDHYGPYYALLHPQPLTTSALQKVLAPKEVLLAYDILPDASVLWVLTHDRLRMVTLPERAVIRGALDTVLHHILLIQDGFDQKLFKTNADIDDVTSFDLPRFASDSFALYKMLIPPSVQQQFVAGARSLVVVPSGPLFNLPFEALVTRDPSKDVHYLIEDVPVSYVPSLSVLGVVRDARRGHWEAPHPLLAFAAPDYGGPPDDFTDASTVISIQSHAYLSTLRRSDTPAPWYPDLREAKAEADAVRRVLGAPRSSIISGPDASLQHILDLNAAHRLTDYRYYLFAAHAALPNPAQGLSQPAIVLAHPERGNGFLTMADIFSLKLNADFVELSACNTGTDAQATGYGVSGLTRAFMYAGTPAISVTLWEMNEDSALRLSPVFFAELKAGATTAEALGKAKVKAFLRDPAQPRFRHPFFWAPMVLFGDGNSSSPRSGAKVGRRTQVAGNS